MITHSINETKEQEAVGVKVGGERACEGEGGHKIWKKRGGVGNIGGGGGQDPSLNYVLVHSVFKYARKITK